MHEVMLGSNLSCLFKKMIGELFLDDMNGYEMKIMFILEVLDKSA